MYFSINPAMLRSARGATIVAAVPDTRILTESDGPYAMVGGRPVAPADMGDLTIRLSRGWNVTPDEAAARVMENMKVLRADTVLMRGGDSRDSQR